jgi:diguanylate cyclase (GGDEF)-like protein
MTERERVAGIAVLNNRLHQSGIALVDQGRPWPHMRSTYFEIGKDGRNTDFVLSDDFLSDLPKTNDYDAAVESYALSVGGRLQVGSPNLFYCTSNRAVSMKIKWPIQGAVFQGTPHAWLLFTVTDAENGSIARCCVDIHRGFIGSEKTVFDDIRNSVNRLRNGIDCGALQFYPSESAHPESYQRAEEEPAKKRSSTTLPDIVNFLAGKAYKLGFQVPEVPGAVFATDPWDAEYLGASNKELSQCAFVLRARGLLELDQTLNFARPSDHLVAAGFPAALGPDQTAKSPQTFNVASLPKKEELEADTKSLLQQHSDFALVLIDLDRFKQVNDTKGHLQGNVCLETVVKAMGVALGRKGRLYRWGGDEFVITLLDFSTAEAIATAERVRKAIEDAKAGGDISVTASIGVCATDLMPNPNEENLVEGADQAMYASKKAGKNRVTSWPIQKSATEGEPS